MSSTNSSFAVANGLAPEASGPRVMPVILDFTDSGEIKENFLIEEANGVIDLIQSVFIDNSGNSATLTLEFDVTGFRLVVEAGKQGLYPVYSNGNLSFTARAVQGSGTARLMFANVPQPFYAAGSAGGSGGMHDTERYTLLHRAMAANEVFVSDPIEVPLWAGAFRYRVGGDVAATLNVECSPDGVNWYTITNAGPVNANSTSTNSLTNVTRFMRLIVTCGAAPATKFFIGIAFAAGV